MTKSSGLASGLNIKISSNAVTGSGGNQSGGGNMLVDVDMEEEVKAAFEFVKAVDVLDVSTGTLTATFCYYFFRCPFPIRILSLVLPLHQLFLENRTRELKCRFVPSLLYQLLSR